MYIYVYACVFVFVCVCMRLGRVQHFSSFIDSLLQVDPEIRVRFMSPHPKDFPHEVRIVIH